MNPLPQRWRREREDEHCLEDDEEVARGGAECCLGDGEAKP
uniref:Uncharacterized protein n=1 Tax=Arundo donax TaxID=35708 RepID=A0A0A9H342_ARUDO